MGALYRIFGCDDNRQVIIKRQFLTGKDMVIRQRMQYGLQPERFERTCKTLWVADTRHRMNPFPALPLLGRYNGATLQMAQTYRKQLKHFLINFMIGRFRAVHQNKIHLFKPGYRFP